jgi:hypothetical protein
LPDEGEAEDTEAAEASRVEAEGVTALELFLEEKTAGMRRLREPRP